MTHREFHGIATSLKKSYQDIPQFSLEADTEDIDEIYQHITINLGQELCRRDTRLSMDMFLGLAGIEEEVNYD